MRRALLLALLLLLLPGAAQARVSLPDLEDEVMCVSCGTALNVSGAPSADRTREFIRRRIAEGLTKQQIKDRLVEEFGRNVLATPAASGRDLWAYLIPVLLAVLAIAAVTATVRRWKRVGGDGLRATDAEALDDDDDARLRADMKAYDL